MAQRTVKAVVTSYVHPDGSVRPALRGEVVEVHSDHVDSFDQSEATASAGAAPASDEVASPLSDILQEPPRAGRGSSVEAWTHHAESLGLTVPEDASREDVIALVDDSK